MGYFPPRLPRCAEGSRDPGLSLRISATSAVQFDAAYSAHDVRSLTSADIYVLFLFMSSQSDNAAEEALLMELAQLGMGLARQLHQAALATTDAVPLLALATAYTKVSRVVRSGATVPAAKRARSARDWRMPRLTLW